MHSAILKFMFSKQATKFDKIFTVDLTSGVVYKLRLQDKAGRWSKNVRFCQRFYHEKCQRMLVGGQEKLKSCQHSL